MIQNGRNNTGDECRNARVAALRMLGLCDRSKKELIERLLRKGYSEAVAGDVADEMESLGYIDDRRFAERFASDAVNRKDAGPQMITSGLQKKGISREIIDDVLVKVSRDYTQADTARRALGRKLNKGGVPRNRNEIRKLSDYLRRRGFSYDIIRDVLKGIEQDDDIV